MTCAKCKRDVTAYFKVERITHGNVIISAEVCSVPCLLQWTYDFATLQGVHVAASVKQKFDQAKGAVAALIDSFRK